MSGELISILDIIENSTEIINNYIIENESRLGESLYDLVDVKSKLENLTKSIESDIIKFNERVGQYASWSESQNTI